MPASSIVVASPLAAANDEEDHFQPSDVGPSEQIFVPPVPISKPVYPEEVNYFYDPPIQSR